MCLDDTNNNMLNLITESPIILSYLQWIPVSSVAYNYSPQVPTGIASAFLSHAMLTNSLNKQLSQLSIIQ